MFLPPAGPSPLPVVSVPPAHTTLPQDPSSLKYNLPGILIFSGLAALVLLGLLARYLWKNRVSITDKLKRLRWRITSCLSAVPVPLSAYLCGIVLPPRPCPTRPSAISACPPPPYEDPQALPDAPVIHYDAELPPGLEYPALVLTDGPGAASDAVRAGGSSLSIPPPAPPPTPDLEPQDAVPAARSGPRGLPPYGPPPTCLPPPVPTPGRVIAHAARVLDPPPPYPPPQLGCTRAPGRESGAGIEEAQAAISALVRPRSLGT